MEVSKEGSVKARELGEPHRSEGELGLDENHSRGSDGELRPLPSLLFREEDDVIGLGESGAMGVLEAEPLAGEDIVTPASKFPAEGPLKTLPPRSRTAQAGSRERRGRTGLDPPQVLHRSVHSSSPG